MARKASAEQQNLLIFIGLWAYGRQVLAISKWRTLLLFHEGDSQPSKTEIFAYFSKRVMEEVDVLEAHDRHNNNGWNSISFQYFYLEFCSRIR